MAHFFYHALEKERINDIFCKIKDDGKIETIVQIGIKILVFNEFSHIRSYCIDIYLNLFPYKNSLIGIQRNFANSRGTLVHRLTEDFKVIPIINIEIVRKSVRNFKEINEWLKLSESDEELDYFNEFQNIYLQMINYNGEELILLRGSINATGVILLIRLIENEFEVLSIHHLKESTSIAIDYVDHGIDLELFCAYIDLNRRDSVFEHIKIQNFKTIESKTITRNRKNNNCRDILDISVADNGLIYMTEMGDKILVYSNDKKEFEEFYFETEEIHLVKYCN